MIRAVFFDWFDTLAHLVPSRVEIWGWAFQQYGIELPDKAIIRGLHTADLYYAEENSRSPVEARSAEEQAKALTLYPKAVLDEAGLEVAEELTFKLIEVAGKQFKEPTFALFEDVLPSLGRFKERGQILGLISNANRDMRALHRELGLENYLDFVITSNEVGADKPQPKIFLAALERAGVEASEAIHVGDQYQLDVLGARGVGINPVLIDRYDISDEYDCPQIRSLSELVQYL